jgi:hypothetical protein
MTLSSGHNYDNGLIIEADMKCVSNAIQSGAYSYEEFYEKLAKQECIGEAEKNKFIRITQVIIVFDKNGNFVKIET